MWDVSNPRAPKELSFFETPGGVHELDLVVRGDGRALALLAVPFAEFENVYFDAGIGGDFRIVDVTNPSAPVELTTWGIIADSNLEIFGGNDEIFSPFQGLGYFAAHYAHSVRAADEGRTAYVSYWDGGVLKFDISNPSRPRLVARTFYGLDDDGDAHSMTPYDVGGHRYIFQNDEDANALSPVLVRSTATGKRRFSGIDEPWAPTLLSERVGALRGRVHDAGDGCQTSDFAGAAGKIALVDTVDPFYVDIIEGWEVPCELSGQVIRAARAGAKALLLNLISPDDAWPFEPEMLDRVQEVAAGMPIVQVSDIDDLAAAIRRALRQRSVIATLRPTTPSFGYLRVFDERQARDVNGDGVPEYRQVGAFFRLPHVRGELEPPPGTWTIHNTEVLGRTAYSSWYSHGIVALDVRSPRRPRKVGQFVPPASARLEEIFGPPGSEVWGVAIDPETNIVYASDMRSGLWIVEPRGPAAD
jgi:hypothetical protein